MTWIADVSGYLNLYQECDPDYIDVEVQIEAIRDLQTGLFIEDRWWQFEVYNVNGNSP